MANIRLAANYGEVVYIGGKCYHIAADQPSAGVPNKSLAEGDVLNISGQTWNVSDPVKDKTWTKCEMCVANMPIHKGNVSWSDEAGVKKTIFTAPYGGIFRGWASPGYWVELDKLLINNVLVDNEWTMYRSFLNAKPYLLASNDVVAIETHPINTGDATAFFIFLPYVWPQPE
jgi:hypothetical protein